MHNNSDIRLESMAAAIPEYERLFGDCPIAEDQMVEMTWRYLVANNNLALGDFIFKGKVVDQTVDIGCEPYAIKSVSTSKPFNWYNGYIAWTDNASILLNYNLPVISEFAPVVVANQETEEEEGKSYLIQDGKYVDAPQGKLINYVCEENCVKVSSDYEDEWIDVIYTFIICDDRGYPMVHTKTIEALAYYIHYIHIRKQFNMGRVAENVLRLAKEEYEQMTAQSRTPASTSTNEWDHLQNKMTSMYRKQYNLQHRTR